MDALEATIEMIQSQGRHKNGVPVIVIFLTDGESKEPSKTESVAKQMHEDLPQVSCDTGLGLLRYEIHLAL